MKKIIALITVFIFVLTGCGSSGISITAGGSTSVQPLFEELSRDYMAENPDYDITYDGTGSSDGITGVEDGTFDIGASSRALEEDEKNPATSEMVIALDGIVIVVHPSNPVTDLSTEELLGIYTGEITNWSEVGGEDQSISVIARDSSSGTRGAFDDIVGIDEDNPMINTALEVPSNGEVLTSVSSNENAIGYVSLATVDDTIKPLTIDGVEANIDTIQSGEYPISRPFLLLYKEENLSAEQMEFITWIDENKAEYAEAGGYVPPAE